MELLPTGRLSPEELWKTCVRRIHDLDPRLNAFITPMLSEPQATDHPGGARLADIPVAVKDLFDTAGVRTTAGSRFFKDHVPTSDAFVVKRINAEGGRIIGKTNTHEVALGVTTVNPHFGTCRNPWDEARIAGGSSGGSAVAVATGMALAAMGTDTGGSIRIPASLCGVVGLKPTFGRVGLTGVLPLSRNLDHAGPLTRTVRDAALMLQVIAGNDPSDPYSANVPVNDYLGTLEDGIRGWRVALGIGEYIQDADREVVAAVDAAVDVLADGGAVVSAVDVSYLREAALANGLMTEADAAAFHGERLNQNPEWFGADVRERLERGRDTTSADYVLARQTQVEMRSRLERLLQTYDVLALPSTPITAPPIGGDSAVAQARRLTRFTAPFNLTGLPAISIPCKLDAKGLPIGLQLVAGPWKEAQLLRAARAFEREGRWGHKGPPCI